MENRNSNFNVQELRWWVLLLYDKTFVNMFSFCLLKALSDFKIIV